MDEVKLFVVVRSDLGMRRKQLVELAAEASLLWINAADQSERGDKIVVELTDEESRWWNGDRTVKFFSVDSEEKIDSIIMRAELESLDVHTIEKKLGSGAAKYAIVIGPAFLSDVNKLVNGLKPL